MARYTVHQVDNRDSEQMYGYLEARIEAMKRRIAELEEQNENLRMWHQCGEFASDADHSATEAMPV
jgi:hypothetical protein